MRCPYGAIAIFIIFFKESETSSIKSGKWKIKMGSTLLFSKGEQDRRDILGTPKRTNPEDFPKLRRTPSMDLVTQNELENHQDRPSRSPARDWYEQHREKKPRSRPKTPQKSRRKKYLPVDSNPLYPEEQGPAPHNQLIMNSEMHSESQVYQMGLQRHGNYAPLLPKPPQFSSYSEPQPDTYFESEAAKQEFRISKQQFGKYPPLYPHPLSYYVPPSRGNTEASGSSHRN